MRAFELVSEAAAELLSRPRGRRRARTVSPAWFRSNVLPVFYGSWEETERFMLADEVERRRLNELAAELSSGRFDYPICVARTGLAVWLRPGMAVTVDYRQFTGRLRHPSIKGVAPAAEPG